MDRYLGSRRARTAADGDVAASAYALSVRPAFDALVGTAAQMSAALLAVSSGLRDGSVAASLVRSAEVSHAEAFDQLRSICVPSIAVHHHRHLVHAAELIGSAILAFKRALVARGSGLDGIICRLRHGWSELNRTTMALPGLSVLNLGHCCGMHALS